MELYLVFLVGAGDMTINLVTKEVFDHIGNDNDRALGCEGEYEIVTTCFDLKAAFDYIRDNDVVIMDTYEGLIY